MKYKLIKLCSANASKVKIGCIFHAEIFDFDKDKDRHNSFYCITKISNGKIYYSRWSSKNQKFNDSTGENFIADYDKYQYFFFNPKQSERTPNHPATGIFL